MQVTSPVAAAFNEAFYLNENADVRAMVTSGKYPNGRVHFLAKGQTEGRYGIAAGVTVRGGAEADRIILREGTETAWGGLGNDLLEGGAGDEVLDGGAGFDRALYAGRRDGYVIVKDGAGFKLTDRSGKEGSDKLVNIERVQFADGMVALDIDGVAGQAFRVYQAAFARTPDLPGLGYWMGMMDNGLSLATVASGFVNSAEFVKAYGVNPTNRGIVEKFYQNILQRAGETAGVDYWTSVLDNQHSILAPTRPTAGAMSKDACMVCLSVYRERISRNVRFGRLRSYLDLPVSTRSGHRLRCRLQSLR